MEGFPLRNLIEQFQDRPLRREECQRLIPLAPRLLNEAAAERMRSQMRLAPAFDARSGMDGGMGVKERSLIVKDCRPVSAVVPDHKGGLSAFRRRPR